MVWSLLHPVRFNRDDLPFSIDNVSNTVYITNGSLEPDRRAHRSNGEDHSPFRWRARSRPAFRPFRS